MIRLPHMIAIAAAPLLLGGCLAQAALDVATAPIKVAGKAVDLATTSQSESDENRGRALRQQEEQLGKLERQYEKQRRRCDDGNRDACEKADDIAEEMDELR
ncbi:MAG: hypothetical protein WA842_12255 [Croceibacterium sp.]